MSPIKLFEWTLDHFYTRQLAGFRRWRADTPSAQHGSVVVRLPSLSFQFDVQGRPTTHFDEAGFIICTETTRDLTLREIGITPTAFAANWSSIFKTGTFEIWENHTQINSPYPLPRFGIDNVLATQLLTFARTCLTESFTHEGDSPAYPAGGTERIDLDVALWVNGELRGSIVVTDQPLYPGIHRAVVLARSDARFKPLTEAELPHTTIEISLINTLRLAIPSADRTRDELIPDVSYRIDCDGQTGWYIPAVFNMMRFSGLHHLTQSLLHEKMRLPLSRLPYAALSIARTHSCCETQNYSPLHLTGPTPDPKVFPPKSLVELAANSLKFLQTMQEPDGNIRLSYNPLYHRFHPIDWARLAFTYKALAAYTKKTNTALGKDIAAQAKGFLFRHLDTEFHPHPNTRALTYIYLLQSDLSETESASFRSLLDTTLPHLTYDPITYSQLAQLYVNWGDFTRAEHYTAIVRTDYLSKLKAGAPIDTASYPELIPLLNTVATHKDDPGSRALAAEIQAWYLAQQLPSGAFRSTQHHTYAYTRGTSKILEILIAQPGVPAEVISRSLAWLTALQYSEAHNWYLTNSARAVLTGGFRHDYFNSEAWIDTNAHILCAFVSQFQRDLSATAPTDLDRHLHHLHHRLHHREIAPQ